MENLFKKTYNQIDYFKAGYQVNELPRELSLSYYFDRHINVGGHYFIGTTRGNGCAICEGYYRDAEKLGMFLRWGGHSIETPPVERN